MATSTNDAERWLTWLLRLGGVLTGSAFFTMFLPVEWMAAIHRDLGLGELPRAPITDYLTRSLSAMYAMHGAILLALSMDVRRYRPVVEVLGWATAVLGVALTAIDLHASMPLWWTLSEGPWVVVIGAVVVWLARRIEDPGPAIDP